MKRILIIASMVIALIFILNVSTQAAASKNKSASTSQVQDAGKKIWNKFCPVMGEAVKAKVKTVEYQGKTIGFCCKGCIKKFNANPEKYMKNLSPDGQTFVGKKK
jgi:YHS domain-containing protein